MVEVGMQVDVEVGAAAMEDAEERKIKKNEENDGSSSEVVQWERFLPRVVLRVLLVEADDSTRQIIAALLRKCSYKVAAAVPDGVAAWETLKDQAHNIDLILTGVELLSISGLALLSLVMEHDICKYIPVIMMSSEYSFSMVLKCMLKGAADFLIKPVRRNELRNLWQHVWRRHMLAGGSASHNLPTTDENNAESNQSNDYRSSTHKTKDEKDTEGFSQRKCTGSNLSDTGREPKGNIVKLGQESLQNDGHAEGISDKLLVSGNSKRFVKEVACCSDTCESIATKLEENSAFVKGMTHDDAVGLQSSRGNAYATIGVGCNDELMDSTGAIDLTASFDKQRMGTLAVSGLSDGANKFEFSPQLELSLRRSCLMSSKNQGTSEKRKLNHSETSAFSRYNNSNSLQPIFSPLAGNREEGDSKTSQDPESNNGTSQSDVVILSDSQENLPNPVKGQSEITSSNAPLGPFSVTGVRIDNVSAGFNNVFPHVYHAQSGLPPACSPKQAAKQEFSPLPVSTSVHSDPDVHDSEQGHPWSNEATISTVDQTGQGQNKQEPVEELRCNSRIGDQSSCSRLCNDVSNHEKSCAHGGDSSWSNASAKGTTPETFNNSNFVRDGLKGMDTHRASQREAALTKFRLKRKERCFEKKVRYQNRKRLAEQRPRVKGQFVRQSQHDTPVYDDSDSPKI